jgi:hypothetical protein
VGHLGFDGHYGWHFTRLHLRYTPDAVTQDIALYSTRDTAREQVRFMLHKWELESELPMCGGEEPDNPGTCFSAGWWAARAEGTVTEDVPLGEVDANSDSICAGLFPLLAVPAGIALRRRYRAGKA